MDVAWRIRRRKREREREGGGREVKGKKDDRDDVSVGDLIKSDET